MKQRTKHLKIQAFSAFFLLLLLTGCLSGCMSVPSANKMPKEPFSVSSPDNVLVYVNTPHPSITVEKYRNKAYPVIWYLVTINLSDSSLSLFADPPATLEYGSVKGETTLAFAKRTGAFVAINTNPFETPGGVPYYATTDRILCGVFIADGIQYSDPSPRYAVLGFTKDKKAFCLEKQTDELPEGTAFAFSGFQQILKNGEHVGKAADIQDSRIAAGVSADGMTLFLLSVEGEIHSMSIGLNYYDCGGILKAAGAADAVQLDGGYSGSLIIQGKNILSYQTLRAVSNNLGIMITSTVY